MSLSAVDSNEPFLPTGITHVAVKGEQAPFQNQSDTPSFWDLLDVVNPLQHIPVVSTIYRAVTGDEIGAVPRIVGDTLFGGPLGLLGAVANEVVRADTGHDIGEHAMAMILPDGLFGSTAVAANTDAKQPQAQTQPPAPPAVDMPVQPLDSGADAAPQAVPSQEPPPVAAQPTQSVEVQSLPAPAKTAAAATGAIPNSLFRPLDRPFDPTTASVPAAPAAVAPPVSSPSPQAEAPASDKIVSSQAGTAANRMADAGLVQPMVSKQAETQAEPKKFEAKASSLNHGKMYANASPYMNKVDPAQKVAQAQGVPVTHPMLQGAQGADNGWMAGKMAEALDKYSRTQKLLPSDEPAAPPPS